MVWLIDTLVALVTIVRRRPHLVYVNSTAAAIYLRPARWLRRRALLHSHESGAVTSQFLEWAHARPELARTTLVACSPSVRTDLAEIAELPLEDVVLLPSVPDDARVLRLAGEAADAKFDAGRSLVVGCCGTVESRKGADLWVEAARKVQRHLPDRDIRFVWIGDVSEAVTTVADEAIDFLGPMANPYPTMASFDVATLPSRDDPFPLVVLESMILGKPVVAFSVGAVAHQIGPTGILVSPGDVDAFADALTVLLVDDEKRYALGEAARERARTHYSTNAFAVQLDRVVHHLTGTT